MKKLLFALAFAGISASGFAQEAETVPGEKFSVVTNSFWSNWFVQANVAGSAFYTNEEVGLDLSQSPFKGFRNNLGFSVALGKWFTPGLGLRTKFNGIWGRTVMSDNKNLNANKYWTLQEQALFNLSNMLCGYNENRVWNFIPYFGAGVGRNMTYNEYSIGVSAGILNTFRLSKRVALNIDLAYGAYASDFSGIGGTPSDRDEVMSAEIGLTFNLGKAKWNKTPDVDAIRALSQGQIDALNAQLADSQNENVKLKTMLVEAQKPAVQQTTVKEVIAAPVSVFFNLGKTKIASKKDLQNVKDLVEVAKANGSKIVVTGYADSKTGSSAFNQKLSQKRAETVADELAKMGVSRDNIEVVAAGGVNSLSPFSYNRRATVVLK